MALHNPTEAAQLAGVSRQTIYKRFNKGDLSAASGTAKPPMFETSELERVFGKLRSPEANDNAQASAVDTRQQELDAQRIEGLERENRTLREQLDRAHALASGLVEAVNKQALLLSAPRPEATHANTQQPEPEAKPPPEPEQRRSLWQRITGRQ